MSVDAAQLVTDMLRDLGITPRGVQVTAIEKGLLEGKSVMVSSPTGSGKTLIGEMALVRGVQDGLIGLYLVPLRALATQVAAGLRERYSDFNIQIGLSTGDFHKNGDELENSDIIVTTYERADSLLRHRSKWLSEVGVIVIDEIQNLSDDQRGGRLESVIIRLKEMLENLQIVALSGTVAVPEVLADWMGCALVESGERPVPLVCRVISSVDRARDVRQFTMTTVQSNGQVIVFNRTRREAEAEARLLAPEVGRQLRPIEKSNLDNEVNSVLNYNAALPTALLPLLHEGVAYHHAGLGTKARALIEQLFDRGLLKVICATTTLAAGMDLPARTVILTSARSPQDYTDYLSANAVHQMLGRAGRPGRDRKGFGIILARSRGEAEHIREQYFDAAEDEVTGKPILLPRFEAVTSALGSPAELTNQLLVALDYMNEGSLQDVADRLLGESYLSHCAIRDTHSPLRLFELGKITAISALERHGLPETIRAAREGVLGTAVIRECTEAVVGGIVTERGLGHYTCRFSAQIGTTGAVKGPMCSCGRPIDKHGILCTHLVTLGVQASKEKEHQADYVIPLSLSESSPYGTLRRLRLIEATSNGNLRPTRLGHVVNLLYLKVQTFKELMALLPMTDDASTLVSLLRHLISIQTGRRLDEEYDHMLGLTVTTDNPVSKIAYPQGTA